MRFIVRTHDPWFVGAKWDPAASNYPPVDGMGRTVITGSDFLIAGGDGGVSIWRPLGGACQLIGLSLLRKGSPNAPGRLLGPID